MLTELQSQAEATGSEEGTCGRLQCPLRTHALRTGMMLRREKQACKDALESGFPGPEQTRWNQDTHGWATRTGQRAQRPEKPFSEERRKGFSGEEQLEASSPQFLHK